MKKLWSLKESWIFYKPVDPVELEIPDYTEVITRPMDFGTIRSKLTNNQYSEGVRDFIADIHLTFDNCLKYNGEDSKVGLICKGIREEFYKIYKQLNMDFY